MVFSSDIELVGERSWRQRLDATPLGNYFRIVEDLIENSQISFSTQEEDIGRYKTNLGDEVYSEFIGSAMDILITGEMRQLYLTDTLGKHFSEADLQAIKWWKNMQALVIGPHLDDDKFMSKIVNKLLTDPDTLLPRLWRKPWDESTQKHFLTALGGYGYKNAYDSFFTWVCASFFPKPFVTAYDAKGFVSSSIRALRSERHPKAPFEYRSDTWLKAQIIECAGVLLHRIIHDDDEIEVQSHWGIDTDEFFVPSRKLGLMQAFMSYQLDDTVSKLDGLLFEMGTFYQAQKDSDL